MKYQHIGRFACFVAILLLLLAVVAWRVGRN